MRINKRILMHILADCIIINLSAIISYFFRFGKTMPLSQLNIYLSMAVYVVVCKIIVFYLLGLYKPIWKYAGIGEIVNIFIMSCIANGMIIIGIYLANYTIVPRSIYLIATLVDFVLISLSRFALQILNHLGIAEAIYADGVVKRVMVIGAGEAGVILVREFKSHPKRKLIAVCFIDDDKSKKGRKINGVPVSGGREAIPLVASAKRIDQIIIAIPSIRKDDLHSILNECSKTGCELKILPSLNELKNISGDIEKALVQKMRDVDIEDLLGREEIELDNDSVKKYIAGKVVLVTGGGGSIGSELCRQLAVFNPSLLVILDFYEENVYNLQNEFKIHIPHQRISICIANVREYDRVLSIMRKYKPSVVFHTAAHKHVPLMEENPAEAVKNNIFGTWNAVNASVAEGVGRFVLISSDKAVYPTNVMGATKRVCEKIMQAANNTSSTEFVAVRFGNVLGSSGSVIPLFKKQISAGGPVTVMHPEIIRYFMTIQEAVSLVIQACAMAKGGEIFVLDMGKPVKIDKLARDLIKLSGFEPDKDIKIMYTGLRPGEKLYEELLMAEEGLSQTIHQKIYIARPMDIKKEDIEADIEKLKAVVDKDDQRVIETLKEIVTTYKCD